MPYLLNCILPYIKEILRKDLTDFDYFSNNEMSIYEKSRGNAIFVDFFKIFDSINMGKMEQKLQANGPLRKSHRYNDAL